MAGKLINLGSFTVATAGTRIQLTNASFDIFSSLLIQADDSNSGKIYVGDTSVDSTNGISLAAGEAAKIAGDFRRDGVEEIHLSDLYIDASADGDSVRVLGLGKR